MTELRRSVTELRRCGSASLRGRLALRQRMGRGLGGSLPYQLFVVLSPPVERHSKNCLGHHRTLAICKLGADELQQRDAAIPQGPVIGFDVFHPMYGIFRSLGRLLMIQKICYMAPIVHQGSKIIIRYGGSISLMKDPFHDNFALVVSVGQYLRLSTGVNDTLLQVGWSCRGTGSKTLRKVYQSLYSKFFGHGRLA